MLRKYLATAILGFTCALPALASAANAGDARVLVAYLNGGNELPGPGDADAFGSATVTLTAANALCYTITTQNLGGAATAAHIHVGNAGVAGGITLALPVNASVPFRIANCIGAPVATVTALRSNPGNFYVNVHSAAFAGGAVRGQLQSE